MNHPKRLVEKFETAEIEGGRKLHNFTFELVDEPDVDRESMGSVVDPSASATAESEGRDG